MHKLFYYYAKFEADMPGYQEQESKLGGSQMATYTGFPFGENVVGAQQAHSNVFLY